MWTADRAVMTDKAALRVSDSNEVFVGSRPPIRCSRKVPNNFSTETTAPGSPNYEKPIVMRIPKETLPGDLSKAAPAGSETYDFYPFELAQLVDREGNIWFGDTKGIHRFSYSPLNRQDFPKEAWGLLDFAVAADDNGAVWISSRTDIPKASLYYVPAAEPSVASRR